MKEITRRSECPVSFCLDFFGDKWTLLIIRDLALNEKNTFADFLNADEHIATNILTDRLKMLEKEGFILKYPVTGKSRTAYCLTRKGIELLPIVIEIAQWGAAQNVNGYRKELGDALKADKIGATESIAAMLLKKLRLVEKQSTDKV